MATSKTIYIIRGDDAPEHMGNLKQILENLRQEGRITDTNELSSDTFDQNSLSVVGKDDMILFILTKAIAPVKTNIEGTLLKLKQIQPGTKIAEIIIDNLTYEMEFIAFPTDLQPVRECQDMDRAWQDIGNSLREMFPQEEKPVAAAAWKKYIPYAIGILVVGALAYFLIPKLMGGKVTANFSYRVLDPVKDDVIANAKECYIPCKVFLSDRSENAETLSWNLGDTTLTGLKEPDYVFRKPGSYKLTLTAINGRNKKEKTHELTVKAPPFAGFEIINNGCTAPCEVNFKNTSQNATNFNWTFQGASTANSTLKNPDKQTFANPGEYSVTLNVTNEDGVKADNLQYVTISPDNAPFADFTYTRISGAGTPSQTYRFTSTSKNATSYRWEVEGDNMIYKTANFDYTFSGYKDYSVKLTIVGDNNQQADTFKNVAVNRYNFELNTEYIYQIEAMRMIESKP